MGGDVIKSFLVGLGFDVDEKSLSQFNQAIKDATIRVIGLYASVTTASGGIGLAISKISEDFEKMGYEYRIIAPAINKALVLRNELLKAYSAAGINIQKVIVSSVKLNMSLAKTKFAMEAIYKSVGSRFLGLLTKQSDVFRQKLYQNMPKIQEALERFIKFVFKAFEALTTLGTRLWGILTRVYDFFVKLDNATDGWSTIILGIVAAWNLLNLSFLATPLGMLITGFVSLLALWDDFKTFKDGGKSLIDWGSETTKTIVGVTTVVAALAAVVGTVIVAIRAWAVAQAALTVILNLNPLALWITAITTLITLIGVLAYKLGLLGDMGKGLGGLSDIGGGVLDYLGGGAKGTGTDADKNSPAKNIAANLQNNPIGKPLTNPVGSNVQNANSNTTQHVNQKTDIHINGGADAHSTGAAVAGQQNRVNFDFTRNLKPVAQ